MMTEKTDTHRNLLPTWCLRLSNYSALRRNTSVQFDADVCQHLLDKPSAHDMAGQELDRKESVDRCPLAVTRTVDEGLRRFRVAMLFRDIFEVWLEQFQRNLGMDSPFANRGTEEACYESPCCQVGHLT